jgi:NTP pyrophosphatase (non-canonical NTP hydrolase)
MEEEQVPATIINDLTEEMMEKFEALRKEILHVDKDVTKFSYRIVAMYGALMLILEKHMLFMAKNGYSSDALEKLEKSFLDSFSLIDMEESASSKIKN